MSTICLVQAEDRNGKPFLFETNLENTGVRQVVEDLVAGQYEPGPVTRIIAVDPEAGSSTDISQEVAEAVSRRSFEREQELTASALHLVEQFNLNAYAEPAEHYRLPAHPTAFDRYLERINADN